MYDCSLIGDIYDTFCVSECVSKNGCNRMQLPTPARHPHRPAVRVGRLGSGARKRWLRFLVKNSSGANENVQNFRISFDKHCINEMLLVNSIYFIVNILYFNIYFELEYLLIRI